MKAFKALACLLLALALLTSREHCSELDDIRAKARQGDAEAQYELGCRYLNGEEVDKDAWEATNWFRRSAKQGYAQAQCRLGTCYYRGEGADRDIEEALKWFEKAAKQGDAQARVALKDFSDIVGVVGQKETKKKAEENQKNADNEHSIRPPSMCKLTMTSDVITLNLPGNAQLEMKKILAGTFLMGSPTDEKGRMGNERRHRVTLTHDYWLGKFEVTHGQWIAVMKRIPSRYFEFQDDVYPLNQISWEEAQEFCDKLNEMFGKDLPHGYKFGLPTEAQWEYACRAGTTTALNNGKELIVNENGISPNLDKVGWYKRGSRGSIHLVGKKEPNAWGLYDMHGNANELCRDSYEKEYADDPEFLHGNEGGLRVIRSGCYRDNASACRAAARRYVRPNDCKYGFRLALVPAP